jgi:Fe-Mn family superoxide dismutase
MAFEVPPLPYDYSALEAAIDTQTMQLHHDKHHATYVTNLNNALQGLPQFDGVAVEDLLKRISEVPENVRQAVINNGGGHANHSMFWQIMSPSGGGAPTGALADAINSTFGSFDQFKTTFNDNGAKRFGSGWTWLVIDGQGRLAALSTPNQDSPYMSGQTPIMGNDVWEHAYYLRYQNRRPDYLAAWWNVVNWEEVAKRFQSATSAH